MLANTLNMLSRRQFIAALASSAVLAHANTMAIAQDLGDPLPSWNDGAAKKSITDFVARVTTEGSADFVPPAERIATFDLDGTLLSEQPLFAQLAFTVDRVKALAPQHPEWATAEPFKTALEGDVKAVGAETAESWLQMAAASHSEMTTEEFRKIVLDWTATARHPRFDRPYTDLVYQPMRELISYLTDNRFKVFIVSGSGVEFLRPWTEKTYGLPPEQVVGSSGVTRFTVDAGGKPVLMKEAKVEFVDDGPGKPVAINRFIGRRPILSFGNSDGDLQMLQWTTAGSGARFAGIVHHTDAEREWAYDRTADIGKLDKAWDEALKRGWTLVSMKSDWKVIYPFEGK